MNTNIPTNSNFLTREDFQAVAQQHLSEGINEPLMIVHDATNKPRIERVSWNGHDVAIASPNPRPANHTTTVYIFQQLLGVHSHLFEPFKEQALTTGLTPSMIQDVSHLIDESVPHSSPISQSDDDLTTVLTSSISSTSLDAQKVSPFIASHDSPQEAIPVNNDIFYDFETNEFSIRQEPFNAILEPMAPLVRSNPEDDVLFYQQKAAEAMFHGATAELNAYEAAATNIKAEIAMRTQADQQTSEALKIILLRSAEFSHQKATYFSNKAQALHNGKPDEAEAWYQASEAVLEVEQSALDFFQATLSQKQNPEQPDKMEACRAATQAAYNLTSLYVLTAEALRDNNDDQATLLQKFTNDAKMIFSFKKNAVLAKNSSVATSWIHRAEKIETILNASLEAADIFLRKNW